MKELISMNEYGLMAGTDYVARVDSRVIADVFGKNHFDVLRSIKRIKGEDSGYSTDFTERNFAVSKYVDETGRKLPCYLLTRDGFVALAMSFTGKKADQFKEAYIQRFNEMEQQILTLQSMREQFPQLTDALKLMADNPDNQFIYSNEMNMLNRIAIGMTAKQYREAHGIPNSEPIRPHLTALEGELLDRLQQADVGLVYSGQSYQERRQKLEWLSYHWKEKKQLETSDDEETTSAA